MRRLACPNTGDEMNVITVSRVPSSPLAEIVPRTTALPPLTTVMKARLTYATPMVGTTPASGATGSGQA